jgi:hypothetical protein
VNGLDGFEDKISAFLSSPGAMEQVMDMAKALSGGGGEEAEAPEEPENPLGGLDPAMLQKLMGLMKTYNQSDDRRETLLRAVTPYLRPERQSKMGRAVQIVRIARTAKSALGENGLLENGLRGLL